MEKKFYEEYKWTEVKFWQNFWDYYKLHIFIVVLAVAMLVVGVRSCLNRVEYDIKVTCICGTEAIDPQKLGTSVEKMTKDLDGDGKVRVEIFNNSILATDTMDMAVTVLNRIDADFIAGDSFILIADEEYIGRFVNMGALQPLEKIIDGLEIPEENVLRDTVTNEIVAVDISKMPASEITGDFSGGKMYLSMKVLPDSKADNEKYLKMHNQVSEVIRKILEY